MINTIMKLLGYNKRINIDFLPLGCEEEFAKTFICSFVNDKSIMEGDVIPSILKSNEEELGIVIIDQYYEWVRK
jgi:hypothetical protein